MHRKKIITAGKKVSDAEKVLILLHGRGGSAEDILSLTRYLDVKEYAFVAPEATNNTWYPLSFLAPPQQNEPWLSSAIDLLDEVVSEIEKQGFNRENIYFTGFSQGACLTLEYTARHATRWGGIVAFTGGLIGDKIYHDNYKGDFEGTPVFIGTSDPDPHVPVARVEATAEILKSMKASVNVEIYRNMGHTISQDEISKANSLVFNSGVFK
jgi:phospholipase/carboxylesterase